MRKLIFSLLALTLFFSSCKKEQNPFEVAKQHVGLLTDSTQIKDLKTIFINDSVAKYTAGDEFAGGINNIEVFKKTGEKLLVLTPENALDSTSTIQSIQIIDPLYKTVKGISTASTFKDIASAYKISKIDNLINSVALSVKEINANFVIDKKELPANLRFDLNLDFEETHIPDNAKIKYFFLMWND
ncbi:hypothetical protein FUA26_10350 [Seonamhaeicola algicola]|uniref:Uncharacterized protein n=1 Tax=Seonamhaeicola algicola TaxID=1719036 RepID=A0A5C7AMP4_9FLAO|nr:hypothetical protein [Seonamhaeicola algicola]TXE09878.1 hypothetical protein FUA26_10350 [Seonamhaeicola algicola]